MSRDDTTGYGPSSNAMGRWSRMYFDGDERKYEQWEIKFLGYMRLQKSDAGKNEEAFAELIQFLDDRSLSLVMIDAVQSRSRLLKSDPASRGFPSSPLSSLPPSSLPLPLEVVWRNFLIYT